MDKELLDYIWDNLEELKKIFPTKVYKILSKFKRDKDIEGFEDTLEYILNIDEALFLKIKKYFKNIKNSEDINSMSIDEIIEILKEKDFLFEGYPIKYIEILKNDIYKKNKYNYNFNYYENKFNEFLVNNKFSLESYENLINGYNDEKKYLDRAEHLIKNCEERDDKCLDLLNTLGKVYMKIGKYDKAESLYIKALEIREKTLGEEHPKTATTYNNLAGLYERMGEYRKAEPLYIKALKTSEKVLGEKHPDTLNIFNNFDDFRETQDKLFFLNSKNSNLEFRVDRVEVKNFKGYKSPFSLEFSENINIIIGENATGKTTLLQALVFGLAKKNFIDIRGLDYSRYITKGESEAEVRIIYNRDREKIVKIETDEIEIDNIYFTPFVLAYNANLFTKYSINPDKIVKSILDETIYKDTVSSIFKDYIDEFWNPLSILKELNRSKHKKAKEKLNIFIETINRFLDGFQLVREDEDYFFKKEGTDIQLELEDLSEGYRSNVLLISDMLIKILGVGCTPKSIEGIVLIDEFDKHLHPRWQSRLVNQLKETFPKIQFIMTTHNPMSILDRAADEVIILEDIDGKIVAKKGRGTKSVDVSIVLLEYFGVDATVGDEMREKINSFNRLKLKKDLTKDEKKELEELEKFLGSTIASNFIYDRKYLKFLEFLRDHKDIDFDKYEKITDEEMNQLLEDFGDFFDD